MNNARDKLKLHITQSLIVVFTVMTIIAIVFCTNAFAQPTDGDDTLQIYNNEGNPSVTKYALIAAAGAFGLGAIGAGIAISHVGAAAMGAVAEKPQIAGQALIFVALAEGIVIFGFITALMILGKV